jgi:hypothetical protein
MSKFPELDGLVSKFPSLVIESYGGACPLQCEGFYQGSAYYFRLRHGIASLSLGGRDVVGKPEYYEEVELSPEYEGDGFIESSDFIKVFTTLLESINSKK